ncbi:MAG: hypothetical protein LBH38_03230, partial [Holosporales bacterium]|nr:hypothetical protein [Holosporales bacterium]
RHYELEIDVLSQFLWHIEHPQKEDHPLYEAHRRMPLSVEADMVRRFDAFKEKFARSSEIR